MKTKITENYQAVSWLKLMLVFVLPAFQIPVSQLENLTVYYSKFIGRSVKPRSL